MAVGARIRRLRKASGRTQRSVAAAAGLAVPYLSRLENDRVAPTVRTLTKISAALDVRTSALLDGDAPLEPSDQCPASLSGRCILDQLSAARGRKPKSDVESYSPEQLEALRLVNFLLHSRDREVVRTLGTMAKSLLALSESRAEATKSTAAPARSVSPKGSIGG